MSKKKVAILIDWYLPGNKAGGPVRSIYSLVNLLGEHFDFSIITTNFDLGSSEPYKEIKPDSWVRCNNVPVFYFSKDNLGPNSLTKVIHDLNPDILYLNSFWSYYFSILPLQLKKQNKIAAKIVLAPRGMLGSGALSLKPFKKKLFLFVSKLRGLHKNVTFHATTSLEEKEIRRFFPSSQIIVASNLNSSPPVKNRSFTKKPGELKLIFLSRVSRVKNLHYALQLLSELKTEGQISYDIYGLIEDEIYWNECKAIIQKLPSNIIVNYKGQLSFEQVQDVISQYHFLFLPTLNENFGHAIAECLLSGCPVIISDQTPWNDINKYQCGYAVSLNDVTGLKKAILTVLQLDNAGYKNMSENSLKFIGQKINPAQNVTEYTRLFL